MRKFIAFCLIVAGLLVLRFGRVVQSPTLIVRGRLLGVAGHVLRASGDPDVIRQAGRLGTGLAEVRDFRSARS